MAESNDYLVLNGERVSSETLKPVPTSPPPPKPKRWWLGLMLRHPILVYVLVVGGIGAILSNYWQPLDKHFPKLNEFIHSDVSDQNDVDYQLYKLKESEKKYAIGISKCDQQNSSFANCRSAIIGAKPALVDMSDRVGKLEAAWQKELTQKAMPESCRQSGTDIYATFRKYVTVEQRVLAVMETVDPNSKPGVTEAGKDLDAIAPIEDEVTSKLRNLPPWPKECAGY